MHTEPGPGGCARRVAIAGSFLWLIVVPPCLVAACGRSTAGRLAALGLLVLLATVPFLVLARRASRSPGWSTCASSAAFLSVLSGAWAIDGGLALLPYLSAGVRMWVRATGLLLYLLLIARAIPRLLRMPASLREWLGLESFRTAPFLLGLASAAWITLPWPLTGSLGDRWTSLELALRSLGHLLPVLPLVWGVGFLLLHCTFHRSWVAALATLFGYAIFCVGRAQFAPGVAPSTGLDVALLLLPSLLLTELRARRSGLYPLLIVTWAAHAVPLLFVDLRDLEVQNPAASHILAYLVCAVVAPLLGLLLWAGRRILEWRARRRGNPNPRAALWSALLVAFLALAAWGSLYATLGEPGFADDGFLIVLREQADLSPAYQISDRRTRLQFVYDRLRETALRTQRPLRAELDALGLPYRPYYLVNMIRVDGHRRWMAHFRNRPDVAEVRLNPNVRRYPRFLALSSWIPEEDVPAGLEPNLEAVHADIAWELGVTGDGIVVAGQDTGYDWRHPLLRPHYRGWDGQTAHHDYNWHDAWDGSPEPVDPDDQHGTHTMGIIVGDDGAGHRTGVAPGARWIGCRNMRRGLGNPGAYIECLEFFLAPYPIGGDPFRDGDVTYAPHLVNNSWGCPPFEGCDPETLRLAVEAVRAAGILLVVSAGNDGPACGTIHTPPANYEGVLTVGATDNLAEIADFSSRGPAGSTLKPDIAAPGVDILSTVPGGGYRSASGTSMAGPHVAGAVALLWSADPQLIGQFEATRDLLCRTARPIPVEQKCRSDRVVCACGDAFGVPNNVYGCGFLDVGAAVRALVK
ncbi:MAG: S8 family serine peptidase [Chloroflexia bacterium]